MSSQTSLGVKARPLDFFVAFVVFLLGFYAFIDPTWPERFSGPVYWILLIEDIYLTLAGAVIMASLIIKETVCAQKKPRLFISSLIMEMFAWLFVSSAAIVITISTPWIPPSAFSADSGPTLWVWAAMWLLLSVAAGLRYWDLRSLARRKTK